jgi:hypothetical protein
LPPPDPEETVPDPIEAAEQTTAIDERAPDARPPTRRPDPSRGGRGRGRRAGPGAAGGRAGGARRELTVLASDLRAVHLALCLLSFRDAFGDNPAWDGYVRDFVHLIRAA